MFCGSETTKHFYPDQLDKDIRETLFGALKGFCSTWHVLTLTEREFISQSLEDRSKVVFKDQLPEELLHGLLGTYIGGILSSNSLLVLIFSF